MTLPSSPDVSPTAGPRAGKGGLRRMGPPSVAARGRGSARADGRRNEGGAMTPHAHPALDPRAVSSTAGPRAGRGGLRRMGPPSITGTRRARARPARCERERAGGELFRRLS
jgi:hypothetical protein